MSAAGDNNTDENPNNITFTIKDTKLYVPVVTLLAKGNQKLLIKDLKGHFIGMNIKQKSKNKNTTNEYRYFLKSNFVGVNRLFVLVYSNQEANFKKFKTGRDYLPKAIIKNYTVIIKGKIFFGQAIDSDIKRYEEIRKLTTGQGEDYIRGCLLDYDFIKNHYRLIAIDFSRKKELDVDPKAIQQIEIVEQLKNEDGINADGAESMFILTILEKIKEIRLTFFQVSVTVL